MEFVVTQKRIGKYIVNLLKERTGSFEIQVFRDGLINYVYGLYVGKDFDCAVKEYYNTCEKYEEETKGE